jgi:large subunit ribosomal protein L15
MKLNELMPVAGSNRQKRRIGRGTGSGRGNTAGKGLNGHLQRSGSGKKAYFEGGQTPLTRRLPKRGFHHPSCVKCQIINLKDLAELDFEGNEITPKLLYEIGIINDLDRPVKILGEGDVTKPLTVKVHACSKSAKEKIEKAKGKIEVTSRG